MSADAFCFCTVSRIVGFLDLQVASRFGLRGLRKRFRQHPLLIGLGLGDGGGAHGFGAFDGGVALGFGGGDIGVALDARHVGPTHVGDVFVLVANFLDGERDDFQAHLVHVVGAGGAHAVAHHLRLLHDLFHGQLADDSAQVAFHHQADQPLALLRRLGEELLGGGVDRFGIGLHLDLRDRFHRHRDALLGVEILLRRDVERHQLEREQAAILDHRENHAAAALDDAGAAKTINHQRLVRTGFAIQLGEHRHQKQDGNHHQGRDDQSRFESSHALLVMLTAVRT